MLTTIPWQAVPAWRTGLSIAVTVVALSLSSIDIAAQEAGSIAGRVIARSADSAVASALVSVEGVGGNLQTDAEGRFRFQGLTPGKHTVVAKRIGFAPLSRQVQMRPGEEISVVLALETEVMELRELTVIGTRQDLDERRTRLAQVAGSVALIESEEIRSTRQANFKDVLGFTPGVFVQPRFGAADESQISIRGSGLRNNFHARGVNILVNGMPYRNTDGFTDFESLELLNTESIEVYKGGNALRLGGSTLGGAINLETKTGYTATPMGVQAEGGSFGFLKAQVWSDSRQAGLLRQLHPDLSRWLSPVRRARSSPGERTSRLRSFGAHRYPRLLFFRPRE
jgi:outer membrane receptor protein involved in Fe transport